MGDTFGGVFKRMLKTSKEDGKAGDDQPSRPRRKGEPGDIVVIWPKKRGSRLARKLACHELGSVDNYDSH